MPRVHLLGGERGHALGALQLEAGGRSHWAGAREVAVECVRREPRLRRRALAVAVAGEPALTGKARAMAALAGARLRPAASSEAPPLSEPTTSA